MGQAVAMKDRAFGLGCLIGMVASIPFWVLVYLAWRWFGWPR